MDLKCFVGMLQVLDWEIGKSMPETPTEAPPQKIYEWTEWLKAKAFIGAALYALECVQNSWEEGVK